MNALTTEPLTLEIEAGAGRLTMRGKTVLVVSCHSFELTGQDGGQVTLNSRETEGGSVSWPLEPKEAGQVWNELFKEVANERSDN